MQNLHEIMKPINQNWSNQLPCLVLVQYFQIFKDYVEEIVRIAILIRGLAWRAAM